MTAELIVAWGKKREHAPKRRQATFVTRIQPGDDAVYITYCGCHFHNEPLGLHHSSPTL